MHMKIRDIHLFTHFIYLPHIYTFTYHRHHKNDHLFAGLMTSSAGVQSLQVCDWWQLSQQLERHLFLNPCPGRGETPHNFLPAMDAKKLCGSLWDFAGLMGHPMQNRWGKVWPGQFRSRSYDVIKKQPPTDFPPKSWFLRLDLLLLTWMEKFRSEEDRIRLYMTSWLFKGQGHWPWLSHTYLSIVAKFAINGASRGPRSERVLCFSHIPVSRVSQPFPVNQGTSTVCHQAIFFRRGWRCCLRNAIRHDKSIKLPKIHVFLFGHERGTRQCIFTSLRLNSFWDLQCIFTSLRLNCF